MREREKERAPHYNDNKSALTHQSRCRGYEDALGALEDTVGGDGLPVAHVHGIGMAKSGESVQERMVDVLRRLGANEERTRRVRGVHAEPGACGARSRPNSNGIARGVRETADIEEIEALQAAGCVDIHIHAAEAAGQWACAGAQTGSAVGAGETSRKFLRQD